MNVNQKKEAKANQKNYLVVGGNSVSGQAMIMALREYHTGREDTCHIAGTSSRLTNIPNVDQSISSIDLSKRNVCQAILEQLHWPHHIDTVLYAPARGLVGLPVDEATDAQIQESIDFSLRPLLELRARLKPRLSIGLSGFVWTEAIFKTYGAMLYAKIVLELLSQRQGQHFKALRIGFFNSQSSRAIFLMACKNIARGLYSQAYSTWREAAKEKQLGMKDFLIKLNHSCEQEEFKKHFRTPYRPTQIEDIKKAVKKLLTGSTKAIVNVLGSGYWEEDKAYPGWSPAIMAKAEKIYQQLQETTQK